MARIVYEIAANPVQLGTSTAMSSRQQTSPLLDGPLAARARVALDAIADALLDARRDAHRPGGAGLAGGPGGEALLHHCLDAARPERGHRARASALLDDALQAGSELTTPGLHSGFLGIAWLLDHMLPTGSADDDANAEIDEAVTGLLDAGSWTAPFDCISGLVGIGAYALERRRRTEAANEMVRLVVQRLDETAERVDRGIVWWTYPRWIPPAARGKRRWRHLDVGLAHGIAGVVAFLAKCRLRGVDDARVDRLLGGATSALLAHVGGPAHNGGWTPNWIGRGLGHERARTAWCYGDPGVASALLLAARAASRSDWEVQAVALAHAAARRPFEHTSCIDGGICHGAAGIAHVLHRLHRATADPVLRDGAREWIERLLEMRRPGEGVAGFVAMIPEPDGQVSARADTSFLVGAAGVGLVLAEALSAELSGWDACLLLPDHDMLAGTRD